MKFLNPILHFIYPPLCLVCDAPREPSNNWLCKTHITALQQNNAQRLACPICGVSILHALCKCTLERTYPVESVVSLFDMDETTRHLVHEIKYKGRRALAAHLSASYAHTIPGPFLKNIDYIIPVPLHYFRRMKRGYNQAECIAHGLWSVMDGPAKLCTNVLKRKRHTHTQTTLDREKRRQNLARAFYIPSTKVSIIKGKRVLIVDDVITTTATVSLCAEVLKAAGCASVKAFSLVRA